MASIDCALIEISILNNVLFRDMAALIELQNVLKLNGLSGIRNTNFICINWHIRAYLL